MHTSILVLLSLESVYYTVYTIRCYFSLSLPLLFLMTYIDRSNSPRCWSLYLLNSSRFFGSPLLPFHERNGFHCFLQKEFEWQVQGSGGHSDCWSNLATCYKKTNIQFCKQYTVEVLVHLIRRYKLHIIFMYSYSCMVLIIFWWKKLL